MTAVCYSQENINNPEPAATTSLEILHFGEDYRLFISSLSDSSVTPGSPGSPQSKYRRTKKLRRKNKRREVINNSFTAQGLGPGNYERREDKKCFNKILYLQSEECFPYESQSEAELEEMFLVVARSHRHIHSVEDRVTEYLSQGFVSTSSASNMKEYVSQRVRESLMTTSDLYVVKL